MSYSHISINIQTEQIIETGPPVSVSQLNNYQKEIQEMFTADTGFDDSNIKAAISKIIEAKIDE